MKIKFIIAATLGLLISGCAMNTDRMYTMPNGMVRYEKTTKSPDFGSPIITTAYDVKGDPHSPNAEYRQVASAGGQAPESIILGGVATGAGTMAGGVVASKVITGGSNAVNGVGNITNIVKVKTQGAKACVNC